MEEQTHIWNLIIRKLSDEATPAEAEELETYLKADAERQYTFEMLTEWWTQRKNTATDKNAADSFQKLKQQLHLSEEQPEEKEPLPPIQYRLWYRRKWTAAAAVILLVGCAAFYFYSGRFSHIKSAATIAGQGVMSQISTNYGSKSKVVLPDGTSVWLNSGSNLTYNNKQFGQTNRNVTLTGEAYFDVAKNAELPFIINAGKINIKVLGTVFDVKSYPEDNIIEATLIRGSIKVTSTNNPNKTVILKPHQKVTVFKDDRMITRNLNTIHNKKMKGFTISPITVIPADSTVVETSWVENKLAFQSMSFSDLAVQMERWYDVKINFSNSKLKHYKFTGIFMNESLDQALKALQITATFNYKIEKDEVYIYK